MCEKSIIFPGETLLCSNLSKFLIVFEYNAKSFVIVFLALFLNGLTKVVYISMWGNPTHFHQAKIIENIEKRQLLT